ncbi:MAG TPA: LLM class F420-dependent oxidoreductase [Candidatus Methylomirabilis sp.]|nr:LLM class F420-dependent oxidoreductase [Candidatus Methylomirabilis sp.]
MPLQYGLFSMTTGLCSYPETAARVARAAEAAGFESLWGGEHVVLPDPQAPPSPLAASDRIIDPVVALMFLAAHTSRVRLGTGIIVLPQRNPLVLAKQLATLDVLSNGRLIFGVGVGYLEAEFRALGAPFEERGAVTDDHLAAIRAIWTQAEPAHRGRFTAFAKVQAHPRPVQKPTPPIVVGGHTPAAFRRAVEQGHGWYGFALDLAGTARCLDGLKEAARRHSRPPELGALEISVTPRGRIDRAAAEAFAAAGVHRLILLPPRGADAAGLEQFVAGVGSELIGRV